MATIASSTGTTVEEELQRKLDVWYWNGVFWERVHWVVGILGVAFSALSAARDVTTYLAPSFAIAATICLGIITFANPQIRSARFLRSYRVLDSALREYRNSLRDLADLLQVHSRAEALLNETEDAVQTKQ
jgi:hypothetical protein